MMSQLLSSYWSVFLAAIFVSSALSVQGHFVLTRSHGPMILALSQIAIIGHLLGKAFFHLHDDHQWLEFLPSIIAYLSGLILFEKINFKDITFISIFIVCMAINHQLISLMPKLDSHMAANLFGDITTVSDTHAYSMALFGVFFLLFFFLKSKNLLKNLIEEVHYGQKPGNFNSFRIFGHILLFLSLYEMGFLFTLAFLILPSLILGKTAKSFQRLSYLAIFFAATSASLGLILSLNGERLSTMPTQILLLVIFLMIPGLVRKFQVINTKR